MARLDAAVNEDVDATVVRPMTNPAALDAPVPINPQRLEALGVLAEGEGGLLLRAHDPVLGRTVAVKVLQQGAGRSSLQSRRLLREARVQARLQHPAIVPVHGLGHAQGLPYFAMQEVRGRTLRAVLDELASGDPDAQAHFPQRRLLSALVQVCRAVDYAHDRGVIHRDLRPENVMLGEYGEVYVLGWGAALVPDEQPADLAAALANLHPEDEAQACAAPELVLGRTIDRRADVYALGAMLFEALTHQPMLPHGVDRRAYALQGRPRAPSEAAPQLDLTPAFDAVVLEATEADPARRTPSARALADTLEELLDGRDELSRRQALAQVHLRRARGTFGDGRGLDPARLEQTFDALLRALALDPQASEARELVQRVLRATPVALPPAVAAHSAAMEARANRELAGIVGLRLATFLAFVPLVVAMDLRNGPLGAGVVAGALALLGGALWLRSSPRAPSWSLVGLLAGMSALLALTTALMGSFVLVPGMAVAGLVMAAAHLRAGPRLTLLTITLGALLGPFALELLGVLPPSAVFTRDGMLVLPRLANLPGGLTTALLAGVTATSLIIPTLLVGRLRDRLAAAERRSLLTTWCLERLAKPLLGARASVG